MARRSAPDRGGLFIGAAVLLAVTLAAGPAPAAETEVRNDSLNPPDTGVVFGDFAVGEMAGVTLTSPCNGSIVAVRIFWLPLGALETLEENIWIFDTATASGGSVHPGPVLLQLEGPVMTPGFMNEFRYLDGGGSVPIDVPVTNGQQFLVALEFGVATDVGGGSASVVRDRDGCQSGRNWLYGRLSDDDPYEWHNFCSAGLLGDIVIRVMVDCEEPTGACCDSEAVCTNDVRESNCQGAGETFFVGQTCAQVTCPAPTGACCNGTGGCLDGQEQTYCENDLTGIYAGNGTTCAQDVCFLGACCMPTGECLQHVEAQCLAEGGTFQGIGTSCDPNPCPQPTGACCISAQTCVDGQTYANCTSWPGEWAGPFTQCFADLCPICDDGDANQDSYVDLADYAKFQMCFGSPAAAGDCKCLDMDNDNDVDLDDCDRFEPALTGPQ